MEATGTDKCIEGSVLVDLCNQRSGRRESGCDAVLENSHAAEENSLTKEKVSKEMTETPLEVVPTDTVESEYF